MMRDRKAFFTYVRKALFGGRLSRSQVAGLEQILDAWARMQGDRDRRFLAYILATAFHETGAAMQPVAENLNYSASGLRRAFPRYFDDSAAARYAGRPEAIANRAYANRLGNGDEASGDGWRFRGRGLVQITGRANYAAYGIADDPDRALEPDAACLILIGGMVEGRFTGRRLADFFDGARADWVEARRIVNALDRADDIAAYARAFLVALEA